MLTLLLRFIAIVLGAIAVVDAALPTTDQAMHVDGHHTTGRLQDRDYSVTLVGGTTDSCGVGYQAYQALRDGDAVTVATSRLVKQCASISRGSDVVHARKHWRLFSLVFGAVLIGVGLGRIKSGDDES